MTPQTLSSGCLVIWRTRIRRVFNRCLHTVAQFKAGLINESYSTPVSEILGQTRPEPLQMHLSMCTGKRYRRKGRKYTPRSVSYLSIVLVVTSVQLQLWIFDNDESRTFVRADMTIALLSF